MSDFFTDGSKDNELRITHRSWNLNEDFHSYHPMFAGLTRENRRVFRKFSLFFNL